MVYINEGGKHKPDGFPFKALSFYILFCLVIMAGVVMTMAHIDALILGGK